jgi:hypothetical protein
MTSETNLLADLEQTFSGSGSPASRPLARVFGVRHLSPAAAHHLTVLLDALRPTAVLVEGPADAIDQIKHLAHKHTQPPLALLAYTQERPVRSILYPLAEYSPEWVALTWGIRHRADVRFIDLPAAVFLQLHQLQEKPPKDDADTSKGDAGKQVGQHTRAYLDDPWEAIARLTGDPDHETWWERHFEHTTDPAAYVRSIFEFGRGLRDWRDLPDDDENLLREAYMRRSIHEILAKGHEPEQVLVVCGAFHAPALTADLAPMSDKELKALPHRPASLTLMPYSYYRLSSQSGYGAGNHAPSYYQRLYEERRAGRAGRLPSRYLTELGQAMRRGGQVLSAAEVIEAVRLAGSLAALAGGSAPCLRDLRDAAITCLGRGDIEVLRPFLAEIEVGHAVGRLPKGISRTSIQDDFYLTLESLKLEKYQTKQQQELELDLRENRFVKSDAAAFRDLHRSTFLHRLRVLGVGFGELLLRDQQGTAREKWRLRWTPECEIQLVESALKGDTVEIATAFVLSERLAECANIGLAAEIVKEAACCQLVDALEDARRRLQAMATEESGFVPLAGAVDSLAEVIRYGSVRKVPPESLRPLLAQLFLRAVLQVRQACLCDRAAVKETQKAILILNRVATEDATDVDAVRWNAELDGIAASDALNPHLAGLACALVLEKGRIGEDELAREVSRRLSPGIAADLGAGWFEGLVQYNRMALFSRLALWRQLDAYLVSLDEEDFRNALVYLRRAFSEFQPGEVRRVVSNLVEVSKDGAEDLRAVADRKLDDEEARQLQEQLGDLELG